MNKQANDKPKKSPKAAVNTELEAKIKELTEALMRERADATNLRRRHEAETASKR